MVGNVGFRQLVEILEPRYVLPSRHYLITKALPTTQKKLRDHMQGMLKDVTAIGFTTDIWSSSVCPMSLLSLTAQWIDHTFTLQRVTLHPQDFRGSHTAERIKEAIQGMLDRWGIEKSRVHVIVRDNARNMKKAMDDMEVKSVGCLAHTLQLAMQEGLLCQRSVVDTLAIARKIIGHFKHSPLAYSCLEDKQLELMMDVRRLQQDVPVRWNSSLYMLQSILEQKQPLLLYAGSYNLPATLTGAQWTLMEKTAEVLVPFEELTKDVSIANASAADVIPAITGYFIFYYNQIISCSCLTC